MTILGRSPNLWLGAVTALFNLAVVYHVLGFSPDATQIGATNIFFGVIIALIANSDKVTTAVKAAAVARNGGGH